MTILTTTHIKSTCIYEIPPKFNRGLSRGYDNGVIVLEEKGNQSPTCIELITWPLVVIQTSYIFLVLPTLLMVTHTNTVYSWFHASTFLLRHDTLLGLRIQIWGLSQQRCLFQQRIPFDTFIQVGCHPSQQNDYNGSDSTINLLPSLRCGHKSELIASCRLREYTIRFYSGVRSYILGSITIV
jgi:hypothetical protein